MDLPAQILVLIFAGAIIASLWCASRAPLFVIQVREGQPEVTTGKVTAAFLQRLKEVVDAYGIKKAKIFGMKRGARVALQFSRQIPAAACQKMRNWWVNAA